MMFIQNPAKLKEAFPNPQILQNSRLKPITLNLKEPYQIEKNFRKVLQMMDGKLDALILCHGVVKNESLMNTNMLEWDNLMNVNVRTHFQLISLAVPFLKITKGNVVVLSSTAGESAQPGSIIYSTGCAMLNMLVKCSALETAYFGIRVNAVAPGITHTQARMKKDSLQFSESENNKFLSEHQRDVPLNNTINQAKDVANSILFLASDDASFMTGEILTIDGGQSETTN